MQIGILGTGPVGRSLADGFARTGHEVTIGTRDVDELLARTEPDGRGNPPFAVWRAEHAGVGLGTFAEVGVDAELLVCATLGSASIAALAAAGLSEMDGRVVIDPSNPLDFSAGFPPSLFVGNTDSLGEQIQRAFPRARVVKAFSMMTAALMVDPEALAGGDHSFMLCGDDATAKDQVTALAQALGWRDILDLGDITNARAMEAYLTLWVRLFGVVNTSMVNVKVVR
jgi:8-hydroxy-5-deazaflavin:NADPH oxidoreductase